mmetsp:Transcript_20489/g.41660  ORF Transcript_20489/g.41660 Transcript_20489/m.41660 type:complete len:266 (-) Transcript_20489:319-1116(-)
MHLQRAPCQRHPRGHPAVRVRACRGGHGVGDKLQEFDQPPPRPGDLDAHLPPRCRRASTILLPAGGAAAASRGEEADQGEGAGGGGGDIELQATGAEAGDCDSEKVYPGDISGKVRRREVAGGLRGQVHEAGRADAARDLSCVRKLAHARLRHGEAVRRAVDRLGDGVVRRAQLREAGTAQLHHQHRQGGGRRGGGSPAEGDACGPGACGGHQDHAVVQQLGVAASVGADDVVHALALGLQAVRDAAAESGGGDGGGHHDVSGLV